MQNVDQAFARRLESCEEMPQVYYARDSGSRGRKLAPKKKKFVAGIWCSPG